MKKLILLLAVVLMTTFTGMSQTSNFYGNANFGDNWSLGVEGGIQTNLNKWNNPQGGLFGLNLNKDLTPMFGLSIESLMGFNNTGNWLYPPRHWHNGNAVDNVTAFLSGRWNVTNSFLGYKGYRRVFEIETNVGAGYGKFFNNSAIAEDEGALLFKTGLNLNFNLGKAKAWTLSLKPAVIWNCSATGKLDSRYAVGQLTASLTYHFKTSNGTHSFVLNSNDALLDEIDALNHRVNYLQAELDNRPLEVTSEVVVKEVVTEVTVPKYIDTTYVVNFAWNSDVLTDEAKAKLDKIPADVTVVVAGYASPEGAEAYNLELSKRRADAVKNYLVTRNIKVKDTVGYGANSPEANRIVVVTITE